MAALNVRELGDFIREQRRSAQISLRQLAKQAGVSNPYLSQIERGLRKPSAEILQQIAKALRISAEVLYVQAGILEERKGGEDVMAAVLADTHLTERQKQVILDIYDAFCRENAVAAKGADSAAAPPQGGTAKSTAAKSSPAKSSAAKTPAAKRTGTRRTGGRDAALTQPRTPDASETDRAADPSPAAAPATAPEETAPRP